VKRRKYNEDLDFKVVDDDGETIAVLGAGRISALNATALAWQTEVRAQGDDDDGGDLHPERQLISSLFLFVRNRLKMKPTSLRRFCLSDQ